MSNLKFCLEAIQLHDDDLGNLTDSIEQYTRAGMPAEQAQLAAIEDTLADVRSDRQGLVDAATAKLGPEPPKTTLDRGDYNARDHVQAPEVAAQGRDGAVAPAPGARDGEAPAYGTPREGSVSHEAVHYSPEPRTRLDASYYGRGLKGAEAERLQGSENDDIRPRVFFYVDKGRGVQPEAGVGANAHRVRLDNLYDVWADPLKLVQSNPGANNWERAIMRAGFDGYVNLDKALPQGYAALIGRRHNAVPVAGANVKAGLAPAPEAAKPLRAALMSRELNAIDTGNIPGATIKNGDLLVPPEQRDAANKELARIGSPVRVRAAVSRAQPGADMERLADLLGPQLYGSMKDMGPVTVKELFQNSFDALKAVIQKQPGFVGRIEIKLDEARRTITLTDNGNGMTPEIINKAFLTMAGTNKETDRSSGGFGIAKMLFLFGNDSLHLETVRDGHKSILATSGAQLKRSFRDPEEAPEIHTEKTREPSGTTVSVRVPEKWRNPSTGEDEEITFPREYSVSDMLRHSPLFEDIEVLVNGSPMPIGANFDKDGYTVFSTVKFDWGTARILISRGEQKTGSYGKNLHVLSNGLWQFSGAVKEDPMDMYSENIPRVIYINVEPRVKPEEPGYPFALNRQGFSPAVRDDFDKITKYLTVLYGGSKAAENAKGFGTIEYVDPTGQVTRSMDLTPKFDEAARKNMLRINEGDRIEVTNGRMIVNGREVPELTKKDLQAAKVDASKYKIPEDQVDPSRPMIHDNMDIEVSQTDELRRELDAKFERIKGERDAARQEMDRLDKERSIAERLGLGHNDAFEKARDRFWELAEALDEVYDEMGTLADGEKQKLPITTYMRRLHGRRFDQYLYSLGNTFMQLRDAIIAEGGTTYRGMTKVPVGVSFDEKYYGVHIQVPFRGMFLNPAITQMDAMDGAHNPRKVGASMLHTMIHEIAHFAEMNHSTEFISEMQRLHSILETSDTFDLGKLVARLTRTLETYSDVYADLNKAVRSDAVSNRGVKLEESAYDGRHDDDAGDVSRQRAQRRDDRHLAGEAAASAGDGAAREDAQGVRRDAQGQRRVTPSKDRSANEEAQEIAKPVLPFLTKDERAKLRRDTAQKLVDLFKQLPSGDEMAAIAWAGKAKRGWYRQSAEALVHIYGADAPRFAAVLAAMSPQTGVEDNLINTVKTWKNWVKAGRPTDRASIFRIMGQSVQGNNLTDSVLPAWVNNTVRALSTPNPEQLVISGPKVNSFMLNLRGEVTEVTNDAWMATFAAIDQRLFAGRLNEAGTDPGKGPGYLAMSARVRQAAKRLSQLTGDLWTPAEVQETVWSWTKTLYELQTVETGALDILYNEEITDELIAATPDFRSLLLEDRYAQQIRETGLGRELDSLGSRRDDAAAGDAAEPRAAGQKAPFAPDAQGRYEKRVAERLERLRAERRAAGAEEVHLSAARDGAGDGSRRGSGGGLAPLAGAPSVAGATGPDPRLVEVAHRYAREHGIALRRQAAYVKVDVERAARIAAAYEAMPHAPSDPKVKAAYADLIRQTREQYDALVAAGYEFTFFDAKTDPYDGNPWNAMRDLRANQRMAVYGTYDGFGTEGITAGAVEDNPLLADTGLTWPDQDGVEHAVTGNDLFRAVHDAFGHGLEGAGFRADGEENAWQAHVRLFTGAAVGALTSETRGQNSWLNFGPFGEKNRTAKVEDTVFAQQKTGLMPEWTWSEGRVADVKLSADRTRAKPGADMERLADLLGPQLYGDMKKMGPVTVKELFQNSFDALKALIQRDPSFEGKIEVKLDKSKRTITLIDNGNGMTPDIINKAFLTMAGTNKETDRSSGGFGIAKMLFLFGNEELTLRTVRDGVESVLETSGAQLKRAFRDPNEAPEIITRKVRNESSGTTVTVKVPAKWRNPSTGDDEAIEFPDRWDVDAILSKSPLFENIEVLVDGSRMNIGKHFAKDDYTVFSTVKFDWGTARILITREPHEMSKYGENMHVLSNGLWQFSGKVKEDPFDMWSDNIPRTIYINVEPRVKPEEPGYPFALNRQGFSPAVKDDFEKIVKYLTVLYGGSKTAEISKGFGRVEYVDADGRVSEPMDLTPKFDDNARKNMLRVAEGDRIEVVDGRMIVNGREVPELTKADLAMAKVDATKFKIPQDQVDASRPMIHDNLDVEVDPNEELRKQADARFQWLKAQRDAARVEMDRLGGERSIGERLGLGKNEAFEKARDRYWELAERLDKVYDEIDALPAGEKVKVPITERMRQLHGERFNQYLFEVGDVFRQLRDAVIAEGGYRYQDMAAVPTGVSFDKEYYGVHVQVPFRGMFLNPAITQMDSAEGDHKPRKVAISMVGTMVHEITHFVNMTHDQGFISEMQRLNALLASSDDFDLGKLTARLTATLEKFNDVYADLNRTVKGDGVSNRGVKLEESSYDGRRDDAAGELAGQRTPGQDDGRMAREAGAGAGARATREDGQGVRGDAAGQGAVRLARARTASPAAAAPQPAAPGRSAWRDATGRLQFAPGQVLYDLLGKAANPLLTRLQLKAASPELRRALREMKVQVAKAQETAARVASQVNTLPDPEREMVSDIIEQQLATGVVPPARAVQVADMMNQIMGQQSAELVRLGMLSQEAANRWNGKYLPRFYQSKLTRSAADLWADAYRKVLGRPRVMKGIGGKHLHSRGLYETIDESELLAYLALGWDVRDPDYDPVNGSPDGTVQIWRDFTPAERQNMGEIRDSGFRFVMGYMQTQKDIALGRLFETLANDATISSRTPTAKLTVQVPKSIIEGTGAKTYGKLAGRYVSPETLSHLSSIEEAQSEMLQLYRKGLSAWKEGKTALNPVSHVNNVLSNLTMAHFAGVSYWDGHKYAMAAVDLATTAPMVREANDAGLFLGTLSDEELMNVLPPALRALARKQEGLGAKTGRIAFNIVSFYLRRPMGWAYKAEDSFFRYLVYRDARKHGASPADAVDYAQRFIFAYDDLPKGARRLRDFAMPFFSYTYKATPALLHTALTHPLRFAAPAAVLWGANAAAFALAYGDDEDEWDEKLRKYVTDPAHRARVREQEELERKHLPPWLKGASALLTPKAIRLGMDELTGLPLYLDASRIIPGGDLFDVSPNAGGLPLPQPLTPSHPLFTTAVAMLANKDMYFGREITDSNDTTGEKAAKRGAWIWRQFSPAIAAGNYHWERGMQALAQATGHPVEWMPDALGGDATGIGRDGLPVQPKFAAMQTFGVKVRPIDLETAERIEQATREKMIREIDIEMRRLNRLVSKGAISERAFDEASELAQEKKDRLRSGLTVDGDERE